MKADRLDQLLAEGNLSGAQYDAIERRVLERVVPRPKRSRWLVAPIAALLAAGVAMPSTYTSEDDFRAKGVAGPELAIDVACGDGKQQCRHGDTLLFSVNAAVTQGYFYAYAQREGWAGGERIWYFPTASGQAPRVTSGEGTVILPEGIRLGQEHASGRYRVTAWVATRPLVRSAIPIGETPFAAARASVAIQIEE
jgi:hypothetical protein